MGKASRWMINFLLGKKEEKTKKNDISFHAEKETTPTATPAYKRRWSFGKSAKKERVYRGRRSLDSIITTPYLAHRSSFALPTAEAIKKVVAQTHAADRIRKAVEDAAATRIQAVFRSYLVFIQTSFYLIFNLSSWMRYVYQLLHFTGQESFVCVEGISQVTSISKGSPGEETNNCNSSTNAYTHDNTSKSLLS
jgi:hypothetical protein